MSKIKQYKSALCCISRTKEICLYNSLFLPRYALFSSYTLYKLYVKVAPTLCQGSSNFVSIFLHLFPPVLHSLVSPCLFSFPSPCFSCLFFPAFSRPLSKLYSLVCCVLFATLSISKCQVVQNPTRNWNWMFVLSTLTINAKYFKPAYKKCCPSSTAKSDRYNNINTPRKGFK